MTSKIMIFVVDVCNSNLVFTLKNCFRNWALGNYLGYVTIA